MLIKLQHCTPEFVKKCCPDQSGSVIHVDGVVLLLTENSVLSTPGVSVELQTPEGERKFWHGDGQLWEHCHFLDGELEGEFKNWYKNGQLWRHCHYANGIFEGEFKWWHGDGRLRLHKLWKNGCMVKDFLDTP